MSEDSQCSNDGEDESEQCQYVVGKDQAPGIINNEMLNRVIREAQGPSLEDIRLCRNVPIDFSTITELCLEFLNILKIDHLWMLTNLRRLSLKCNKVDKIENLDNLINLRELDLSFNCIERIENLECLLRLERLSLFRNNIRRIENVEHLTEIVRLSLGNNLIDSTNGIILMQSMKKLYSLNLDGNPIVDNLDGNVDFRLYIAAHLPDLKYYGYSIITSTEREKGREVFKSELRVLDEIRTEELARHELEKCEIEHMEHMTQCFVENLDENQLFQRLFSNGKHKQMMESHEIEIEHIVEQYRPQVLKQTEKICELGKDNYNVRSHEISQYEESIAESRAATQAEDIELVENFREEKNDLIEQAQRIYHELAQIVKDETADTAGKIAEWEESHKKYETLVDNVWYSLMERETTIHERIEEIREYFSSNITEYVHQFMSNVKEPFAVIRIACEEYFKMLEDKIVASKVSDGDLDETCAMDRTQQLAVIDRREDDLLSQAHKWLSMHLDKYKNEENECNRMKILEINNFLDAQRTVYDQTLDALATQLRLTECFQTYF